MNMKDFIRGLWRAEDDELQRRMDEQGPWYADSRLWDAVKPFVLPSTALKPGTAFKAFQTAQKPLKDNKEGTQT